MKKKVELQKKQRRRKEAGEHKNSVLKDQGNAADSENKNFAAGHIHESKFAQMAPSISHKKRGKSTGQDQLKNVILTSAVKKPENQMTSLEKMHIVRTGISKADLEHLKNKARLDYDRLAKILSVARATLINKKGKEKFGPGLSEKIVGLADIYSYGYQVFESEDRFNQWIFNPNMALGGHAPFDLIDNQFGREEVKSLIGRIDYGVFS